MNLNIYKFQADIIIKHILIFYKSVLHIIGAGPAGIALAYYASKKKIKNIALYEQSSTIGGLARSWRHHDFILDTGPHIFHTSDKEIADEWLHIGSDIFNFGDFKSCNILKDYPDKLFNYPLSIETLIDNIPTELFKQIENELHQIKIKDSSKDALNFQDFMFGKMGKTITKLFFTDYPKKLWGIDTDQMLADWAPQRIELREKSGPFYTKEFVAVANQGTGSFYQRIIDLLTKEKGFKLFKRNSLTGLEFSNSNIKKLIFNNKHEINITSEDYVISTIPAIQLAKFLGSEINFKFRGVRSQYLFFNNKKILPQDYNWIYCSDKDYEFNRITEPSSMASKVSPRGFSFICVENTFDSSKANLPKFDDNHNEIISWMSNNSGFNVNGYLPELNTYNCEKFVYPIQDKTFRRCLAKYNSLISNINNLNVLGTGGEFHYSDMQIIFRKSKTLIDSLDHPLENDSQYNIPLINNLKINNDPHKSVKIFAQEKNNISFLHQITKTKVPLIAEIGINHNGDINLAKSMMLSAKKAGAHIAKFQYYQKDTRIEKNSLTEFLHETADGTEISLIEILERSRITIGNCIDLVEYGKNINFPVFFSVFDIDSANNLKKMGEKIVKVASMDSNNIMLHKALNELNFNSVIISTGMTDILEIQRTLTMYEKNKEVLLMSCRSSYPTNFEDIELGEINYLKEKTNCIVGYSDHTEGIITSLLSVAAGAQFLERHFTTNKNLPGPDNKMSIDFLETQSLCEKLKSVSNSLDIKRKVIHSSEQNTFSMQKKSLRFPKNLKAGSIIHTDDLIAIAPPKGYSPLHIEIKRSKLKVLKDVSKEEPISKDNIKIIN